MMLMVVILVNNETAMLSTSWTWPSYIVARLHDKRETCGFRSGCGKGRLGRGGRLERRGSSLGWVKFRFTSPNFPSS